jgi:hypothetical protein
VTVFKKTVTKLIFFLIKKIYTSVPTADLQASNNERKRTRKKKKDEHQPRINLHMRQEHKHQYLLWSLLMISALRNTLCKQLLYPSTLQPKTHYHFQTSLKHMPKDFHQFRIRTTLIKNNKITYINFIAEKNVISCMEAKKVHNAPVNC